MRKEESSWRRPECVLTLSRVQNKNHGVFIEIWKGGLMGTILLIILVLLLVGALPTWPYSSGWGYYPSGGLGLILLVLILLLVMGRV